MRFGYSIAPLGKGRPAAREVRCDVSATSTSPRSAARSSGPASASAGRALRPHLARVAARTLRRPHGRRRPDGRRRQPAWPCSARTIPPSVLAARTRTRGAWGPFNNDPRILGDVPIGGDLTSRSRPEWITIAPSVMATPRTFVAFEGRTAYGERSTIPFHVTSADWQESDRVLAGIMTAFGSSTTGGARRRLRASSTA